jgi:hypothetical protein
MTRILFAPFSALGGLLAGLLGKRVFAAVWSLIDKEEPARPEHRDAPWSKVVLALSLEGAVFRTVRGVVDRSMRVAFYTLTGAWPGEKKPDPTHE